MNKKIEVSESRKKEIHEIVESFHLIRNKIMAEHAKMPHGADITHSQWLVLGLVHKHQDLNLKKIAELLSMTSSAATQLVDGLVAQGAVVREVDPEDRRSTHVRLSPSMNKELSGLRKHSAEKISVLFEVLTDEELSEYARIHKKIAEHFTTC